MLFSCHETLLFVIILKQVPTKKTTVAGLTWIAEVTFE